ncbi:MAG: hypothetical protein HY426_01670 [Candidatus Levybacteria bacterium]|nr:hypothetical protein [Candidatus Levybacteria bacterium]
MKKIFLTFIFFIVLITSPVYAKTGLAPTESIPIPTQSLSPSPTPVMIDYQLPYPGILPGNPLYSLKMIRDRIMEFLISDPLKKSNFYLLQADKRLASSLMLFEKGEEKLGQTTLSKGQKYLEKSLDKAIEAKESKKDIGDIFARIKNSATKQKQEIEKLGAKSKDMEQKLKGDLLKIQSIEKRADILTP